MQKRKLIALFIAIVCCAEASTAQLPYGISTLKKTTQRKVANNTLIRYETQTFVDSFSGSNNGYLAQASTEDFLSPHEEAGECIGGTEQSCIELVNRSESGKESKILVIRTGTTDETGIYTVCTPRESDPENTPNIGIFSESGAGGIRIIINTSTVRSSLVKVIQEPILEGEDSSDGSIEATSGTATFLDKIPSGTNDRLTECGVDFTPKSDSSAILVTQGKTRLTGSRLIYEGTDGIARISGPISFRRDNDSESLSGSSDIIEMNVQEDFTTLLGNVIISSTDGRTSKAERIEYDDRRNEARLYATKDRPAESTKGRDKISITSGYIYYNLSSNDIVVFSEAGGISGEFSDEDRK